MNAKLETMRAYCMVLVDLINNTQDGDYSRQTRDEMRAVLAALLTIGIQIATEIDQVARTGDILEDF